jgi:hypothetical protein
MYTKNITKSEKRNYVGKLPRILLLIFGCMMVTLMSANMASAQCQYDWQQKALGINIGRIPSPEIGMTNADKIRIAKECEELFIKFIDNAGRPDPEHWRDQPRACRELAPVGRIGMELNTPQYTQYYKPLGHPKSARDKVAIHRWYTDFDCPTRQAIRLLEQKNIRIPPKLIVYRMAKPTSSGDYNSPTIISRTGIWEPIGHIIIPEFDDREYTQYSPDLGLPGVILSSIGEILHERSAGEFYYTLSNKRPRNGNAVSPRASRSAYFFVADVFAGWVRGKSYPREVWDEYKSYRGPIYSFSMR